jgi:hypothetical protein
VSRRQSQNAFAPTVARSGSRGTMLRIARTNAGSYSPIATIISRSNGHPAALPDPACRTATSRCRTSYPAASSSSRPKHLSLYPRVPAWTQISTGPSAGTLDTAAVTTSPVSTRWHGTFTTATATAIAPFALIS